ncbi:DNA polymerase III subunit delta [Aliidiomarina celeris]|uniref:DNA polymerase III subunit delta n=1 Tax=Aliidiomarina celeris TaxID=2249428 RepID=UPI000DEA3568|nr:DNA polymerase III subunit delta [Aliidiomarina celeris]
MQVQTNKLTEHLSQALKPCYLVFGDEPFLCQQALDEIRKAAKQQGFEERIQLTQDKQFDWNELHSQGQTQSLFSSQQLIELELPDASPGRDGGAALQSFIASQSPDQCLLVFGPRINKTTQSTKWFKALEKHGVFVPIYTPDRDRLPNYIQQRARVHNVQLDNSALAQLSLWYEGNLLALEQALMKLSLQEPNRLAPWTAHEIEQNASDQSRYDIFMLRDTLVTGQLERYLHSLERLHEMGTEPVLMLWALHKLQSILDQLARTLAHGGSTKTVFNQERIWQHQGEFERLARAYTPQMNMHLSTLLERAEMAIKRASGENIMVLFAHFGISLLRSQQLEALKPYRYA